MKTLYIECNMGAAGDMLMAALSELIPDPDGFVAQMNGLNLPGLCFERQAAEKCGITGTHMRVTVDGEEEHAHDHHHDDDHPHDHHHDDESAHEHHHADDHAHHHGDAHEHDHHHDDHTHAHHGHDHPHGGGEHAHEHGHHHHASLADVEGIIGGLPLPEAVRSNAAQVYRRLAEAEAQVHGRAIDQIHFHEVGTLDAIADVVGVCALMAELAPEQVVVSPVHVGSGQVHCAHGILPVPAPATALLLKDVPIYGGRVRGELCTPTGAALLTHFADRFGDMPAMRVEKIGYGMGTKDFEWANCVRAMLGETQNAADEVVELRCNIDDMTGEQLAFAMEALRAEGALDVSCAAVQMKKGRPGTLLMCLCRPEEEARFAALMLRHTTTLGVRCAPMRRYTLCREATTLETPYGVVHAKRSSGYGVERVKPEFDDLAEIARRQGIALDQALDGGAKRRTD